ncbi:hypothetical protein A3765_28430 [Oleiphilus sp. HI0130]|nr:hypothetical protein A3765_29920 [Oleiphilus sp. HI0130]KZZ72479.1 hypothetical protein A3765_28430 [Oleiphilus sp. HI0130]
MIKFLTGIKGYAVAVLAFFLALFTAKYYRGKAKRLDKQLSQEKAKIHNVEAQLKAAKRRREKNQQEIDDALKDDSHLDYFDKS